MYLAKKTYPKNRALAWRNWFLAVIVIVVTGSVYRVIASRLEIITETPITLPVPLSKFPFEIGQWNGKDVPITESVLRVAGNDDFVNRLYVNESQNQWANVYVAYTARPRTMLGHRPQVCYVGGGWIHDSTEASEVISSAGRSIQCLIHRFHKPAPANREIVVLNFYILNGQLTADESGFSGLGLRTPNIAGTAARYVAQIQISSVLENSVRSLAKDVTDLILDFFPDKEGFVRATENAGSTVSFPK